MESGSIVALATAVLSVLLVFLEAKNRKWLERGRFFAKLFDDIVSAAEDDKTTEAEFQRIVSEAEKVIAKVGK
jgi:hypothetical protein